MHLIKLSDMPILQVVNKCIKNKWELNRYWKSSYVDKDIYYILNSDKEKIYDDLSHDEL